MYKVGENQKCTEWPQTELEDLTVKGTLYTLSTYPWGPNCGPFRSTISRFRDNIYTVGENRKCTEWLQTELEDLTVKSTLCTLILTPEAHILVRFALRLAISEMQHVQGRWNKWPQIEREHLAAKINTL